MVTGQTGCPEIGTQTSTPRCSAYSVYRIEKLIHVTQTTLTMNRALQWRLGTLTLLLLFLNVEAPAQQPAPDLSGIWSGTFISSNSDISPFTVTVKINKNSKGHFVGDANLISDCLDSPRLTVTFNGSEVRLEGNDSKGDGVSFKGTLDATGTVLTLKYIINGSPSGRCEIDNGTGSMGKR